MDYLFTFFKSTWYLWVFIILVSLYRLFRPVIKGFLGEKSVTLCLSRLDSNKYKVINNIMVDTGAGTSQIDHVIVSNYGIFVIETKNYKGWILGREQDDNWTQVIYRHKEKLHNPIKQNYGHIMALKKDLVDFPNINYFSIITFSPVADLKVKTTTPVVYMHRLTGEIRKHTQENLTAEQRDIIVARLLALNVDNPDNRKVHVQAIKLNLEKNEELASADICPKCGSALVQRNGKYGPFKGCTNFPKCRFIAR